MAKLAEAMGEPITEPRIEIYFEDLSDFPIEAVVFGIKRARKESRWFPKIPELREYANEAMVDLPKERIGEDCQLPKTIQMTEEQARESRERVKNLIQDMKRKLGWEKEEESPEEKQMRFNERKKILEGQKIILVWNKAEGTNGL